MSPTQPTRRPWTVIEGNSPRRAAPGKNAQLFVWLFSIVMVLTAGTAFTFKLIEFFLTATQEGSGALASFLIPVFTYLMVAAGFMCLFFWAWSSGQFEDIEGPKYRLLEMADEWDHRESPGTHPTAGGGA